MMRVPCEEKGGNGDFWFFFFDVSHTTTTMVAILPLPPSQAPSFHPSLLLPFITPLVRGCRLTLVDQNFFMVCSTVPVAWTVTVSPLETTGPLPGLRTCA